MDHQMTWNQLTIGEQISNIGSEVERALKWKDRDEKRCIEFLNKAIEMIERTQMDPKNNRRIGELGNCKVELLDYFVGDNIYGTTEKQLRDYYDAFLV